MMEDIKDVWATLNNKGEVLKRAGSKFRLSPTSIKSNWIHGNGVPHEQQKEFLKFLKKAEKAYQAYLKKLKNL